ncbi:MAG: pectate lyase family protein [Flavisolibacter sp.]
MKFIYQVYFILFTTTGCAQKIIVENSEDRPIAFSTAEGFGKYSTGGRGGKVFIVNNLNDNGEGSLRNALKTKEPKFILFSVSGTIHLQSPLNISPNTTIAGQSAPGDGICVADYPVSLGGNNIIIRYMRFRMGDKNQNKGMVQGSGHDDVLSANRRTNIIIDHCSLSWSNDEVLSVYAGDSTTLQWNMIYEPLNYSYHFETGDTDYERHGYGGIMGGRHISIHHNLFAHCQGRTPRFDGIRNIQPDMEFGDFRNNVIYNWGGNNVYGGEGGEYNLVNNYYKPGPNTSKNTSSRIANPFRSDKIPYGKWFINGNYMDRSVEVTENNWNGVVIDKGSAKDIDDVKMNSSFAIIPVSTHSAEEAIQLVLNHSGASYKRDTLDMRIINDVKNRTGRIIDVQGDYPHGTPYEQTIKAWPALQTKPALADTDRDGMPDEWEQKKALNHLDPNDASAYKLHKHLTNIEIYLEEIVVAKL